MIDYIPVVNPTSPVIFVWASMSFIYFTKENESWGFFSSSHTQAYIRADLHFNFILPDCSTGFLMLHDLLEVGSSFLKLAYWFFANFQGSVSDCQACMLRKSLKLIVSTWYWYVALAGIFAPLSSALLYYLS